MKISFLFESVMRGHSLIRVYENWILKKLVLQGKGIDLGAKSTNAMYYSYLDMDKVTSMEFVDYYTSGDGIHQVDLERPFGLPENTNDFILLFNVLEHIFDTRNVLGESRKILKEGGRLHGMVPFLVRYHPDPNDYFRFTPAALERLLSEEGFRNIEISEIAYGPFKSAANIAGRYLYFRPVIFLAYLTAIGLDGLLGRFSRGMNVFSIGYYFTAVR